MRDHDITIDYEAEAQEWVCSAKSERGTFMFRGKTPQQALARSMRQIATASIRLVAEERQREERARRCTNAT